MKWPSGMALGGEEEGEKERRERKKEEICGDDGRQRLCLSSKTPVTSSFLGTKQQIRQYHFHQGSTERISTRSPNMKPRATFSCV